MTDFFSKQAPAIEAVFKLKRKMLERKITYAWTVCPACNGKLYARLAGRKNHIHAYCTTEGCVRLME